jgi:hypothetical protein
MLYRWYYSVIYALIQMQMIVSIYEIYFFSLISFYIKQKDD